ncbi:MAG: carbohydrate-binding protein, partial [Bacteroidales bacterium]|nr:carbohydrate-binding protein [Bacteroidales bacterium]
MKKISSMAIVLLSAFGVYAQVNITVDIKADVKAISPYVYGANDANTVSTAIRWGGNRTSAYNWETNFSNAGKDYGPHVSDAYFGSESQGLAAPIITMTQTAKNRGQYALVTLQAMGYVAADAKGKVTETQKAPSERWDEVKFRKVDAENNQLPLSLTPDKTDGVVYTDEELNFLINKLGTVGRGGIDGFAIDNEPALWSSTHALAHPVFNNTNRPVTPREELLEKTEAVAAVVKEYAPQTEVYGPMFYGWWDAFDGNAFNGYPKDKGYKWFVDYYLDEIKALEEKYGKRMVDVLAIHWYPEDRANNNRIVDLDRTGYSLTTPEMITARLRAPRELWDPTAKKNSGAVGFLSGAPLITALQESIKNVYPGTKLAFTEFKYDAENHFSGGLALVDVLGVFGREGVYMACKWDPLTQNYALAAYNLYRNYDNKGGTFGGTSVRATTAHNDTISTVASLDDFGNLHLIVVNKNAEPQDINYVLQNGIFVSGQAFGFDATSAAIKELDAIETIENNVFTYTVPAYSATHFVLQAAEQTQLVHAVIPNDNAQTVVLSFDSDINITTPEEVAQQVELRKENGDVIDILDVQKTTANQITIHVDYTFTENDSLCTIDFNGTSIIGKSEFPIHDFSQIAIKNQLPGAPTMIYDAFVTYNGKTIIVNTSKEIDSNELLLIKNNETSEWTAIQQNSENQYQYILSVNPRITKFDTIVLAYDHNTVQALNKGPYESPRIDSIVIRDNFTLYAYSNVALVETDFNNVGFSIRQGEKELHITSITYDSNRFTISVSDTLKSAIEYEFYYKDTDAVKSLMGGYLDDIEGQEISNRLKLEPAFVVINADTTKIEAEDFSYYTSSTMKLEECSDAEGGLCLTSLGRGNSFVYTIDVIQAGIYTFSLRHANPSISAIEIMANEQSYQLDLPSTTTVTNWMHSAIVLELPQGKQNLRFEIIQSSPSINYFEIIKGAYPSNAQVISTIISRDKTTLNLSYDRLIETLPKPEELTVLVNGESIETTVNYRGTNKTQLEIRFPQAIAGEFVFSYSETSG